jgi:hypothetical protein
MKLCAAVLGSVVMSLVSVANAADIVKTSSGVSPFVDDGGSAYNIICPLFSIVNLGDGWLEYCNAYRTTCDDIPDPGFAMFDPEPEPCDCPNSSGCENAIGSYSLYDAVKPLPCKVPADGPLPGLNKSIVMCKSMPGYFMKDDEPVYVRVMEMVYVDKDAPQKNRSFILGLEMKSPLTGIEGLKELDAKPTSVPFVYTINRPAQTILIIRALGVTNGKDKQPKLAKTAPSSGSN